MIISKSSEYAIRAVVYMRNNTGTRRTIDEISEATNTPKPLLAKILQVLVSKKILESRKGPNGGFYLPEEGSTAITIKDITNIFSVKKNDILCPLDGKTCGDKPICELHNKYMQCINTIEKFHAITIL